jgi:aspartyl protease family protein
MSGLSLLLLAAALLVGLFAKAPLAGFDPSDAAAALAYAAVGALLTGWAIDQFRGRWSTALQALLTWALLLVGLSSAYSYRFELQGVASRILGDLAPDEAVVTSPGEVSVTRRLDGSFLVAGRANDTDLRFVFDTGASTVVLTAESAERLGFHPGRLSYRVPVSTANGRALTAPVTIERLSVGPITMSRVRALVAPAGMLYENLLGMTFLERLSSYEVRGNRLFLRSAPSQG